ncbi:DUF378 domain-containing protein [Planococcus shenhongbingii]|uniref:DUF378 domain-containing protein n=1 Tax=Planococcus shenhongbingii TaxID=3058398 RepID=A0ABT8NB08_9BACL|nr:MULTISPECIES: DUF378 domain-containing protein [unclassified Planococcus (in: firmicutes)]MDN7245071.1 DUF378 domain-containing protein [Planococcus sp. N017]WKA58166.1 DUF378 domain-containing protein [Planococcus sp. N016]
MKALNSIALILLIIGGVNWLLVGLFQFDLVAAIFGGEVGTKSAFSRIIYVIVGLCALYALRFLPMVNHDHRHSDVRR